MKFSAVVALAMIGTCQAYSSRAPVSGGVQGSSHVPSQYGKVSVDNPWGEHQATGFYPDTAAGPSNSYQYVASPSAGGGNKMIPQTKLDMPIGRGQIATMTGGNEGASKLLGKTDTTKWATTKWAGSGKGIDAAFDVVEVPVGPMPIKFIRPILHLISHSMDS